MRYDMRCVAACVRKAEASDEELSGTNGASNVK